MSMNTEEVVQLILSGKIGEFFNMHAQSSHMFNENYISSISVTELYLSLDILNMLGKIYIRDHERKYK